MTRRRGNDQSPGGAGSLGASCRKVGRRRQQRADLGLLLLLLGYLTGVGILQKLVVVLLVVGAVLWILGAMGRPVPAVGNW